MCSVYVYYTYILIYTIYRLRYFVYIYKYNGNQEVLYKAELETTVIRNRRVPHQICLKSRSFGTGVCLTSLAFVNVSMQCHFYINIMKQSSCVATLFCIFNIYIKCYNTGYSSDTYYLILFNLKLT